MTIQRINTQGRKYHLYDFGGNEKTEIVLVGSDKSMTVQHPMESLNRAWFLWTQQGFHIQNAFPFLTPDEREFLLTGITPEEWKEIFKDSEK